MDFDAPSLEESRRLYEAAIQVKNMAPWQWMLETEVFGVENPESGELGFVSVMGQLGEHFSIALYLGAEGLYGLWDVAWEGADPLTLFSINHFQASFEDRKELEEQDRALIKQLGLKFRGRNAWAMFRSYRPGFFPWFVEAAEARFLTHALEQLLDVAPRFANDDMLLMDDDDEIYLVRTPVPEGNALRWEDRKVLLQRPKEPPIDITVDMNLFERVKQLKAQSTNIEADFQLLPMPIGERNERPIMPYMMMVVDGLSGMIMGYELLQVETTLEDLWGTLPQHMLVPLAKAGIRPKQINIRSEILAMVMQPIAAQLNIQIVESDRLPMLDEALESMLGFLAR